MKSVLRKIIPKKIFDLYYMLFAFLGALFYGFPSRKMIVIGVTGTKGKTTTTNFIHGVLQAGGIKTGVVTTANIKIGDQEEINSFHMTMPGRCVIQKFLKKMHKAGCEVAIIETTSQGLAQFRHIGISYDVGVFTNLFPEHIESHGSFENYKKAKGELFRVLQKSPAKFWKGNIFQKTIIANIDSEHAPFYFSFPADRKVSFAIEKVSDYTPDVVGEDASGVSFTLHGKKYTLSLAGKFNVINALPALIVGELCGVEFEKLQLGLKNVSVIPGRMEEIISGQKFRVFVDYAHEGKSMALATQTARSLAGVHKTIVLLGAEGGGRDKAKRAAMGEVVGKYADTVVVSNVDPYDDDPFPIADDIAKAVRKEGKKDEKDLFVILDRREGIKTALSLALPGDVVMITGKGSEQTMLIGGKEIPWDDRVVVKEELAKILS